MNIFSFITVSGTYTLQAGWSSVLIIPEGDVQIVNSASPPEDITITAPLKMGNGFDQYGQLVINGTATLIINGDSIVSNHVVPGSAIWGSISGNPVNQSDIQNGTIQGTFTPVNSVVVQNDTFKTAFQKLQGQVSSNWNIAGNTLTSRGTFGSSSGTFGWDYVINNSVVASVTNSAAFTFGLSTPLSGAWMSWKSQGFDSGTFTFKFQNSDEIQTLALRDDGYLFTQDLLLANSLRQSDGSIIQTGRQIFDTGAALSADYQNRQLVGNWGFVNQAVTSFIFGIDQAGLNVYIGDGGNYGSGSGVLYIKNAVTVPTVNPTAGGIVYVEAGALTFRGSAGTISVIAPA